MCHGSPDERAELRRSVMRPPDDGSEAVATPGERIMASRGKGQKAVKTNKAQTRKSSRSSDAKSI
jgi:ATP-dependent DNA helicase